MRENPKKESFIGKYFSIGHDSTAKKARFDGDENAEASTTDSAASFEAQTAAQKNATIRTIGTITPVEDFKILIEQGSPVFTDVCKQMSALILELINNSRGESLFEKALQCLQCLRETCIQKLEPKIFNDLENLIKKQATNIDGRKDFWNKLVDGKRR